MARQFSWSDVRGGLIATAVIVVFAFIILKFSRVGALHGDTLQVYALVSEARGVTPGSEVWLSGQKVGKITRISFRPAASSDTSRRILIEMKVLAEYQTAVHGDAMAQIRSGGSFIGAPVVYLTPGTIHARPLATGDTLVSLPQADVEGTTSEFGSASALFPVIITNVKTLVAGLRSPTGTAGSMLNGSALGELGKVRLHVGSVMGRAQGGGTVGLVMQGGLTRRAGQVMARADSIRALLGSSHTSLGRFHRDTTLVAEVADIRKELALVQRELNEPRGTAGRVLRDSAISVSLAKTRQEMTLLFADLKKHPLRYISLSSFSF